MAAATTLLAATTAAFSVGKGIHDMSRGSRMASENMDKLENYDRQSLDNAYAGMSVPTQGFEMQKEQAMQTQAQLGSILSKQGARGAVGGAPGLAESTRETFDAISGELTQAEFQMRQLFAEDEARIRGMVERREEQDIAGLGSRVAYGESLQDAGGSRLISTLGSTANLAANIWGDSAGGGQPAGNTEPFSPPSNSYSVYANDPTNFRLEMPDINYNPASGPWQNRIGGNS